ncbi:MAG: pyridoxamine 5'-phosphate oxidase family protein [Pyrinomonadaceae bacterium]
MIEIRLMSKKEMREMLQRVRYGHLACCHDGHPYVVPIHFGYDGEYVYIFTTEGKKTAIIDANPEICLQIEDVADNDKWQSVIVIGDAERTTTNEDRAKALLAVTEVNPTLTPALNIRWVDKWVQEVRDIEAIYRVKPKEISGRQTA